ncbi:zonadhesin-like [Arctopsyche grandis]|uniref:zonadhesin-like n=1 Tax=Arctopsyche grandis TaxID=121162 RepID=UPI00406D7547
MVSWSIVLTVCLAIAARVTADCNEPEPCGSNEVRSKNSNCRRTCNVRTVDPDCVEKLGCMCDMNNGFLYNSKGVCVPKGECDSPCEGDMGKVFDPCGNSCARTCENINDPNWKCEPECTNEGACRCIDGLVENIYGNCVKPEDCFQECGDAEAYSHCLANKCQNTCEAPNKRMNCPIWTCRSGCVCAGLWIRDNTNRICIPPHLCGVSCDGDDNAFLSHCVSKCDNIKCSGIKGERPICNKKCTNIKGCVCKPGYYRQDGKCTPEKDCPKCDGENEEYVSRKCQFKCGSFFTSCLEEGEDGCYCKLGYARDNVGKCIPLDQCNQESCNGDPNAYFEQCNIECQNTCEYKEGVPNCVKGICTKKGGCVCKKGFVLSPCGKCIKPEECYYRKKSDLPRTPPCTQPPKPSPPAGCGRNEHIDPNPYVETTDQTCDMYFKGIQPKIVQLSSPSAKRVCRCLPAYVRNNKGQCVIPQDCCDDLNAQFISGPNTCPGGTCKNPQFTCCNNPWQPFGCQCKPGYLKISDCNPKCVPIGECCKYN